MPRNKANILTKGLLIRIKTVILGLNYMRIGLLSLIPTIDFQLNAPFSSHFLTCAYQTGESGSIFQALFYCPFAIKDRFLSSYASVTAKTMYLFEHVCLLLPRRYVGLNE